MVFMGKIAFTISTLCIAAIARAQDDQSLIVKGNESYKKQQFSKAAEDYKKATEINAKNVKAQYNLGNALYKTKKIEEAQKAFDAASGITSDPSMKSKELYNEGVTFSRQNKLNESIRSYKETLRLNAEDEEARENLQKALNELKKQQSPPQPKQDNKKQDNNKNKNQQPQPQPQNNSKLNQKQVEKMLNALRQDEKKLQQEVQKRNNTGTVNSKDW